MKEIIDFLRELAANNNREWFQAHKDEYRRCKARFDEFVVELIEEMRKMDPSIGALPPTACTYRIYRDVRFSSDKRPYKTHMGAFIAPMGKKSGYSGYYVQVGPHDDGGYDSGCMLATGNYYCEPQVLALMRDDIVLDEGAAMTAAIKRAKGFTLDRDQALKRVPRGFPADEPYSDLLRLKNFCLVKDPGIDFMLQPNLKERLVHEFKATKPFLYLINRAIQFVNEEGRD